SRPSASCTAKRKPFVTWKKPTTYALRVSPGCSILQNATSCTPMNAIARSSSASDFLPRIDLAWTRQANRSRQLRWQDERATCSTRAIFERLEIEAFESDGGVHERDDSGRAAAAFAHTLDRMRDAVCRHLDQLHGPAGAVDPGADLAALDRMDGAAVRLHRGRISVCVCAGIDCRGPDGGQAADAFRLLDGA